MGTLCRGGLVSDVIFVSGRGAGRRGGGGGGHALSEKFVGRLVFFKWFLCQRVGLGLA